MKATCDREKLLQVFQLANSVVPTRSPKPVLANVKLEAAEDRATLMATDLEIAIRAEASGVEVHSPGEVLLPVKQFGMILRESTDEKLVLESTGEHVLIRGQRSRFQLPTADPAEFPVVESFQEERYHTVSTRLFRELIRRTVFATDPESSRYALGGVLLELGKDSITGVATDGRRLARQQGPAETAEQAENEEAAEPVDQAAAPATQQSGKSTIVPTRAMQLLERALTDNEEPLQLAVRESSVIVRSGRTTIFSRLVEGRYPNWRNAFPKEPAQAKIQVPVGAFLAAVRQAGIVTSKEQRGVDFTFAEGKLLLAGHGAEEGESQVELPIAYDGEEVIVRLDPRYVSDFLRVLDAEQVCTVELRGSDKGLVFQTDDGYAYIVMPLSRA